MTFLLFAGDLIVMAFMFGVVTWLFLRSSNSKLDEAAKIPLEDERHEG